jgi:hypothetical protein
MGTVNGGHGAASPRRKAGRPSAGLLLGARSGVGEVTVRVTSGIEEIVSVIGNPARSLRLGLASACSIRTLAAGKLPIQIRLCRDERNAPTLRAELSVLYMAHGSCVLTVLWRGFGGMKLALLVVYGVLHLQIVA